MSWKILYYRKCRKYCWLCNFHKINLYKYFFLECLEAQLLELSLCCHATGPGFDTWSGQNWLSLSSLKWIDKMSSKFTWELNVGGPASGWLLDKGICYGIQGPMVMGFSRYQGTANLNPSRTVVPRSLVFLSTIWLIILANA